MTVHVARLLPVLFVAMAALGASPARAEYISFDDSQSGALTVGAGGFTAQPFEVDGTALTDGSTYTIYYTGLAKGASVAFSGSFVNFGPVTGTTVYAFVPPTAPGRPFALLSFSTSAVDANVEAVSGTFYGLGSPNLPGSVPDGATLEVTAYDPSSGLDLAFPQLSPRLGTLVALDASSLTAQPVPEPASMALLGFAVALLAAARRFRSRLGHRAARQGA